MAKYLFPIFMLVVLVSCSPGETALNEEQVKEEVWQTLEALSTAWATDGNTEALKDYFHETMVAITPSDRERLEGRDACIAAWKSFVDAAEIHSWRDYDPKVQLYGDGKFAVVTCYWEMSYEMDGREYDSSGRDMVVLVKEDSRWWVVADKFSPFPGE